MNTTTLGNEYSHMAINLIGIVLILLVLMYILKKVRTSKVTNNRDIKIINAVSIGAKEKVILLEVNNTTLLVGATPNQIATLHVFNGSEYGSISEKYRHDDHTDEMSAFSKEMAALKYSK
jgi:flagellar biosynthetic protein FliO